MARFGQAPKASKPPQQLSQALEPHNPPQQLSKACRLLGHGTSLGPTSCFYWASKLLCGTFWARPKSLKTSAAAFEGLRTSQPSAAAFEGVPLASPWYLPRPHKLCLFGLRNCYVARFEAPKASKPPQQLSQALEPHTPPQHLSKACRLPMVPPQAPQAVSIGLRNCYVARFGQAPKASKPPQQLSQALEPHTPPQQLSKASRLLGHGTPQAVSIGLRNCYVARFGQAPKAPKPPQQLSQALEPHTPPQQLSKASRLLGHGTSLGPASCFSWASKLLCGTFWAGPKSFKTSAAAFEGLRTSQPSAATFEGEPIAWPWFRNCYVARFGQALKASKPPQQLSKALEPHNPPGCLAMVPP